MSGVTMAPGTALRVRSAPGNVVLLVTELSDADLAHAALTEAAERIRRLPGEPPAFVAGPYETPQGPFLLLDSTHLSDVDLEKVPNLLREQLERYEIAHAVITVPGGATPLFFLNTYPNLALLMVFPLFGPDQLLKDTHIPIQWPPAVLRWLLAAPEASQLTGIFGRHVELPLAQDQVVEVIGAALTADTGLVLTAGSSQERLTAVCLEPGGPLLVGVGGPSLTKSELAAVVSELRDFARGLPQVGYAAISVDPDWRAFFSESYESSQHPFPYRQPQSAAQFCDEVILDGLHWQLMSDGHRRRLGDLPEGAVELRDGRWELTVGDAEDWWPDGLWPGRIGWTRGTENVPNQNVRSEARRLLAGLLLAPADHDYLVKRSERRRAKR